MADQKYHIIIVEDDSLIAQMYQKSLANAAFSVELAVDGEAGWTAINEHSPDLIILDFMMPKLNGVEVLTKIRSDEKLKNIPVIVMSSLMGDADKKRALDAGATAYWIKSEISMVDFEKRILEVITASDQK